MRDKVYWWGITSYMTQSPLIAEYCGNEANRPTTSKYIDGPRSSITRIKRMRRTFNRSSKPPPFLQQIRLVKL